MLADICADWTGELAEAGEAGVAGFCDWAEACPVPEGGAGEGYSATAAAGGGRIAGGSGVRKYGKCPELLPNCYPRSPARTACKGHQSETISHLPFEKMRLIPRPIDRIMTR
jgi:hypothetical protein